MSSKVIELSISWLVGVVGLAFVTGELRARELSLESLPAAKQTGGSCGFFANVPAVTLATGIDISTSPSFVQSIYGLRRGDFRYQRSFDKRMFYELFSMNYVETKIEHPPGIAKAMMPRVRQIITERFHEGLAKRRVYSLRIRGVFNGPHNGLLIGRRGNGYLLHDPYPGVIKTVSLDELASLMLVRSTAEKNRGKTVFVTHYLTIGLSPRPPSRITGVRSLPPSLDASLSAAQRHKLAGLLAGRMPSQAESGVAKVVEEYPNLDFAVLPGSGKKRKARNVIGSGLKAEELGGMINLSKFTLNTWHQKNRRLLPAVLMDGEPWVLVRYLAADPTQPDKATLVFDNGNEILWLSRGEALAKIRKDGAFYATVVMDWD